MEKIYKLANSRFAKILNYSIISTLNMHLSAIIFMVYQGKYWQFSYSLLFVVLWYVWLDSKITRNSCADSDASDVTIDPAVRSRDGFFLGVAIFSNVVGSFLLAVNLHIIFEIDIRICFFFIFFVFWLLNYYFIYYKKFSDLFE